MYDSYHSISTPENVDLRLELAGIGNRILACFIDTFCSYSLIFLLWSGIVLGGTAIAYLIYRLKINLNLGQEDFSRIAVVVVAVGLLATFVINFGYFIFFEGLWQGQTPGKKVAGIRVVGENGEPVSWQAVLLRNVMRMLDEGLFLIGLIFMIVEKDEKRMGDLAAGTVVIRERKAIKPQILKKDNTESAAVDDFSTPSPFSQLSDEEYDLLSSFLRRRKFMLKLQRAEMAKKLADHWFAKLNQDNQKTPPINSEAYLEELSAKL